MAEMKMFGLFALNLFLLLVNGISAHDEEEPNYLLPGDIVPNHYDLRLNTYIERFSDDDDSSFAFDGSVGIVMVPVKDKVKTIVINSHETINVTKAVLNVKGSSPVSLGSGEFDRITQKLSFKLNSPLVKNQEVVLNITYTGMHRFCQEGFYTTIYEQGVEKKYILNTQFQAAYARMVFPCFDEPRYKATYKISVGVSHKMVAKGYRALSNAPEEFVEQSDRMVFHFKKTALPISSYLIAVLVADFDSSPPRYFNGAYPGTGQPDKKVFRTWGPGDDIIYSTMAQSAGTTLMEIYTNDFKIQYGYDKMDQAVVPYFRGAMENWGLVFYADYLLVPDTDSYKREISQIIAHELSHQWFGNLVTMHWWSDLWLNEGFATYFEYFGADKLRTPEVNTADLRLEIMFVAETVQGFAFQEDLPGLGHPLTFEVYDPKELVYIFDSIEYDKGGSVIRMWSHILGSETFKKALRIYLQKNKEGMSTPQSLFTSFDEFASQSVSKLPDLPSKIFKCWQIQEGYPVLDVALALGSGIEYEITQDVFNYRRNGAVKRKDSKWTIPISYSTSDYYNFNDTRATFWLKENETLLLLPLANPTRWIILNNQLTGYYRVNYDLRNWRELLLHLSSPSTIRSIHEINRMQIIDDVANLARSTMRDFVSYQFFMDLTNYLKIERSYYPWKTALNNFDYLNRMLSKSATDHVLFKKHMLHIMEELYRELSLTDATGDEVRQLTSELTSWTCKMGSLDCERASKARFQALVTERKALPGYLTAATYCSAAKDDAAWSTLWNLYLNSKSVMEKSQLIGGLSCSRNHENLMSLLNRSIDARRIIQPGERVLILSSVYDAEPENVNLLLDFITSNYAKVHELYGGPKPFHDVLVKLARGLGTDEELSKMKYLINSVRSSGLTLREESVAKVVEIMETNNEWLKIRSKDVHHWLREHYG